MSDKQKRVQGNVRVVLEITTPELTVDHDLCEPLNDTISDYVGKMFPSGSGSVLMEVDVTNSWNPDREDR